MSVYFEELELDDEALKSLEPFNIQAKVARKNCRDVSLMKKTSIFKMLEILAVKKCFQGYLDCKNVSEERKANSELVN